MESNQAKQAAGKRAASLIEPGMLIGLGTGSTVTFFIQELAYRCQEGLKIKAVASSAASFTLAKNRGIPLIDSLNLPLKTKSFSLDLTVDGADEIDPEKEMIKGGGGALLREKILASISCELVVIIDSSKKVKKLGSRPLPVEVLPFCHQVVAQHIRNLGYNPSLRVSPSGAPTLTENGNYIYDLDISLYKKPWKDLEFELTEIPGVLETGLFLKRAGRVITGFSDGSSTIDP